LKVIVDAVGIRGHGGAAVLLELLHWLPRVRPEWQWHVFVLPRQQRLFDDPPASSGLKLEEISKANGPFGRMVWIESRLWKKVRRLNGDVLLAFANAASGRPRIPQVVFCQQMLPFTKGVVRSETAIRRFRVASMKWLILRGAAASSAVIVQTQIMATRMQELSPSLEGHIHVIPSGYRTPSASPIVRPQIARLVNDSSCPRLIYVAHPGEHKNHVALIRALPRLIRNYPGVRLLLTIVENTGPRATLYEELVEEMKEAARQNGSLEHLVWLGTLEPDEVNYALAQSDLMIFPSLAESFGLPLAEALHAGCPVAVSDREYAREVLGKAGLFFNPLDPGDIAEKVGRLLGNPGEMARLKMEGSRRAIQYDYLTIAENIARVLETAAARS
jgi:glycosyltransferase involved in cell wall biosynthesis